MYRHDSGNRRLQTIDRGHSMRVVVVGLDRVRISNEALWMPAPEYKRAANMKPQPDPILPTQEMARNALSTMCESMKVHVGHLRKRRAEVGFVIDGHLTPCRSDDPRKYLTLWLYMALFYNMIPLFLRSVGAPLALIRSVERWEYAQSEEEYQIIVLSPAAQRVRTWIESLARLSLAYGYELRNRAGTRHVAFRLINTPRETEMCTMAPDGVNFNEISFVEFPRYVMFGEYVFFLIA